MSFDFTGSYGLPGIAAALETVEKQIWWNRWEDCVWRSAVIEGAARDAGNTSYTDVLRPGLLLGKLDSNDKFTEYDPTASDGSQRVYGVLGFAQKMQRMGSNQDRYIGWVMCAGCVKAGSLLIPGSTSYGISAATNEHLIRAQMHPRFLFDDQIWGNPFSGILDIQAKTADYTVLEADNNALFTNRGAGGAVNFTLPATAKKGLSYRFYVVADQTVTLTAGTADTLITYNDAAADSVALSTAGNKIGGAFQVVGDGTGWLLMFMPAQTSDGTATGQRITIAT